jgi:hypothetical protein
VSYTLAAAKKEAAKQVAKEADAHLEEDALIDEV